MRWIFPGDEDKLIPSIFQENRLNYPRRRGGQQNFTAVQPRQGSEIGLLDEFDFETFVSIKSEIERHEVVQHIHRVIDQSDFYPVRQLSLPPLDSESKKIHSIFPKDLFLGLQGEGWMIP